VKTEQLELIMSELARWPGVDYTHEPGGNHPRLRFRYGSSERFLVYSKTKVDPRGLLNKVTELRRLLHTLGATRDRK
jgi:hypothetical protein